VKPESDKKTGGITTDHAEFKRCEAEANEKLKKLLAIKGKKTAVEFHRESGKVIWEYVGMARDKAGLEHAIKRIQELREEFWRNVTVTGSADNLNTALERANRVADYLEFGELLALDALTREESCGGHFRTEHQQIGDDGKPNGECERDDDQFCHVAAWEYAGPDKAPIRNTEPLEFEVVHLTKRSYK
jgi:succinate dehydrogenase / fumarate reductase flavoprotein subunit